MLRYLPFILVLAVWIYAFIDCLNTPEKEIRKLPKVAWVLIILLFGQVLLGPVAWFAVGRPRRNAPYGATRPDERRWVAPDDNPDFLKSINDGAAPRSTRKDEGADADKGEGEGGNQSAESGRDDARTADGGEAGTAAGTAEADPAPQEAEQRRREEESRRRENGAGGTDDTP